MNPRIANLVGQTFGRLTVLEMTRSRIDNTIRWRCRCTCGLVTTSHPISLKNGTTKSCGCLGDETRRKHHFRGKSPCKELT
jgi:hypothetical protein